MATDWEFNSLRGYRNWLSSTPAPPSYIVDVIEAWIEGLLEEPRQYPSAEVITDSENRFELRNVHRTDAFGIAIEYMIDWRDHTIDVSYVKDEASGSD